MIRWMSCCRATSPSKHKDSSTEASEHIDSVTEALELLSTERNFLVHVGSIWDSVSSTSILSLPGLDDAEENRCEGGACEEYTECGWV